MSNERPLDWAGRVLLVGIICLIAVVMVAVFAVAYSMNHANTPAPTPTPSGAHT